MKSKKQTPFNFTKSLSELEEINAWFQTEDIDLDQGITKFKQGLEIISRCQKHLQKIENEFREVRAEYQEENPDILSDDLPEE